MKFTSSTPAKFILSIGSSFVLASLVIVVLFNYPLDQRIVIKPLNSKSIDYNNEELVSRLFSKRSNFTIDMTLSEYNEKIRDIKKSEKNLLENQSHRFTNPYEVDLTLGVYPEKLESRKALLIPAGKRIQIQPEIIKLSSRFSFSSIAVKNNSALKISSRHETLALIQMKKPPPQADTSSFVNKYMYRLFDPDHDVQGAKWRTHTVDLPNTLKDEIEIKCQGKGDCFITDIDFYKPVTQDSKRKKNFIVFLVDTMRHDAINQKNSPFINDLKSRSISFPNMRAIGNMTSPSTNSLLSCQKPPFIEPLLNYSISKEKQEDYYKKEHLSFPYEISRMGWKTGMIGNISVISEVLGIGVDHGFQEKIAIESHGYDTPKIAREAIRWINNNKAHPFMLYIHFHGPHSPYKPPIYDIYKTYTDLNDFTSSANFLKWLYKGEIHYTDRYVKKVYDALEYLGLNENTHILVTADHGDHQESRIFRDNDIGPSFHGSYFDHGATLYEDEIKVPLLIHLANNDQQNLIDLPISGIDIGPTILDLLNINIPAWCSGMSFKNPIQNINSNHKDYKNRVIGLVGLHRRAIILNNRFKYIRQYSPVNKKVHLNHSYTLKNYSYFSKELLFDLEKDPKEFQNLAHSNVELLHSMKIKFNQYFNIETIYKLFIDNPNKDKIKIEWQSNNPTYTKNKSYTSTLKSSTQIKDLPVIYQNDQKLEIKFGSIGLHQLSQLQLLPVEDDEPISHKPSQSPSVIIKKIELSRYKNLISTQLSPAFENIMKEWGYISEDVKDIQ